MRKLFSLAAAATIFLAACETTPVEQETLVFPAAPEKARYVFEQTIFGSHAVKDETSGDRFKAFATGSADRGKGFAKPYDVAAAKGRVYVSDTVNAHVAMLDFVNLEYRELGKDGEGRMKKPMGLAVDGAGVLYVSDPVHKSVFVFDQDGDFVRTIGSKADFDRPTGVAVNADGSRIYVIDTGGVESENHKITVFDAAGKLLSVIGKRGGGDGEFNLPLLGQVGPDGNLYVMDTGNFRVQVLDPEGVYISQFGEAGRLAGRMAHPKGIAVDASGRVIVSDSSFANFQIFNGDGKLLMFIGERDTAPEPAKYMLPAGVSVDIDGRIYVVDQYHRKVDVFRPAYLPEGAAHGVVTPEPADWAVVSVPSGPEANTPDPDQAEGIVGTETHYEVDPTIFPDAEAVDAAEDGAEQTP